MKILKISIKNINSLEGEQAIIDFTAAPFNGSGIFSIVGVTGAGKTSVLDAITISLYNKVARNAKTEDIITYNSTASWAITEFQVNDKIYRAEWHNALLRKNRNEKHELYEFVNNEWIILETMLSKTRPLIESITGLNYEQFTKSILLAQGAFAAFLKSDDKERAQLLEQITGGEIYSKLGKRAYQEYIERENIVKQIEERLSVYKILSPTDLDTRKKEIEELKKSVLTNEAILELKNKQYEWYMTFKIIQNEYTEAEKAFHFSQKQQQSFGIKQTRLEQHHRAQTLALDLYNIEQLFKQKQTDEQEYLSLLTDTANYYTAYQQQLSLDKQAISYKMQIQEKELEALKKNINELEYWLTENGSDAALPEKLALISLQFTNFMNEETRLETVEKELKQVIKYKLDSKEKETKNIEKEREIAAEIEKLTGERLQKLGNFANLTDLENYGKKQNDQQKQLKNAEKYYTDYMERIENLEKEKENVENLGIILSNFDSRLLEMLDNEERVLQYLKEAELAFNDFHAALNYEEARHELEAGKPCPLCGATEHPFANLLKGEIGRKKEALDRAKFRHDSLKGEITKTLHKQTSIVEKYQRGLEQIREMETQIHAFEQEHFSFVSIDMLGKLRLPDYLLHKIEELQLELDQSREDYRMIKHTEIKLETLKLDYEKAKSMTLLAANEYQNKNEKELELQMEISRLMEKISTQKQDLWQEIAPFGLSNIHKTTLIDLEKRKNEFQNKEKDYKLKKENQTELETIYQQINTQKQNLAAKSERLNTDIERWKQSHHRLSAVLISKLPFNFSLNDLEQGTYKTIGQLDNAATRAENSSLAYLQAEKDLLPKLEAIHFPNKEAAKAALLDEKTVQNWQKEEKEILLAVEKTTDTWKQSQITYEHILQSRPSETEQELLHEKQRLSNENKLNHIRQGNIQQELQKDAELNQELNLLKKEKEEKQLDLMRWEKLNALIGSAKGDKFRKFAQSLTLTQLVVLANRHLEKISPRYQIKQPDPTQTKGGDSLELQIVDTYQANHTRPMKTLSGGESFLVSLGLALGLSDMASKNRKIQSLFIDEGFGTLDADTLDTVMNALEQLQLTGKMVGIISHVTMLRERIPVQISIKKGSNGLSKLSISE